MSRITADSGGVDKSALGKILFLFSWSFIGLICFSSYLQVCRDANINAADCKYVYYGGVANGSDGVNALAYAFLYAVMVVVSLFGIITVCTVKQTCSKIFAITLVVVFGAISLCDYISMGSIGNVVSGSARNFYVTHMFLLWIAEVGLVLNTAWDAFDYADEYEVDIRDTKRSENAVGSASKLSAQNEDHASKADLEDHATKEDLFSRDAKIKAKEAPQVA